MALLRKTIPIKHLHSFALRTQANQSYQQKPHERPGSQKTPLDGFTDKLTRVGKQHSKGTECIKSRKCNEMCRKSDSFPAVGICEQALLYVSLWLWSYKILRTTWYVQARRKSKTLLPLFFSCAKETNKCRVISDKYTILWKQNYKIL